MVDHNHYSYRVFWSDEDEAFIGICAEFPRMSNIDETPEKALKGIISVIGNAVELLAENGEAIPEPLNSRRYSGRFHVRVTPEIHRNLVVEAAEQGVSLNRYVCAKLA
jgi:predicted HicB family RNase H-like nuclease